MAVAFVWVFGAAFILFKLIALTIGLRVKPEEEMQGLDIGEHGATCYPDFASATRTFGGGD